MFDKLIVRRVLETPGVYAWFQKTVAKKNGRKNFLEEYLGDVKGKRILDLGCGTADVLEYIEGEKLYVGIDYNEQYIKNNKKAVRNLPDRLVFHRFNAALSFFGKYHMNGFFIFVKELSLFNDHLGLGFIDMNLVHIITSAIE